MRFAPNPSFVYSKGWNFRLVNRGRVNNAGFVNDQDYQRERATQLVAIVGDSYVEAVMVRYADTVHGRLARLLAPIRVYSFAMSGAPLSQYLAYLDHACANYRPTAYAIVVIGNDFDESLLEYVPKPGMLQFKRSDDTLELVRLDYRPGVFNRAFRTSALARYLVYNLDVRAVPRKLSDLWRRQRYVGNTAIDADPRRLASSRDAVDMFFRELHRRKECVGVHNIVFIVDGMRPELYSAAALEATAGSYFDQMRRYFMQVAARAGYEVIDLQPLFVDRYRIEGKRFDFFPIDGHWNSLGHAVAADAIAASRVLRAMR